MSALQKNILAITAAVIAEFGVLLGIIWFQQTVLMSFPLAARAVLVIALQWLLLIVPAVLMRKYKISFIDIGFTKEHIGIQLIVGVLIAAVMSLALTVLPILAGLKYMVGATLYTQPWQFCYQFVYMIFGVALAEEFFYRGFLFRKLLDINSSKWFAIIVSSILFGISHIFNSGNIIQAVTTSMLGVLFCVCRDKIKNCSTLSLIVAHGINNALITLFVYIL